jgi:amidase
VERLASNEFELLDATALAELVRSSQVKPAELTEAAVARIERLNPAINAVIAVVPERIAAPSDVEASFTGVPFVLKDLIDRLAGVPLTEGSAFLRSYVPTRNSELVERFERAGLGIIGKTNTPEFGILGTTEPRLFGATRNPWAIDRSAGGSSGGAAAAVAAGMAPMAHASDAAGSIRIPASCCGLFGLKPSRGRVPVDPERADVSSGLWTEHVITRSVRDSAALLDAISSPRGAERHTHPAHVSSFRDHVGQTTGSLRIGLSSAAPTGVPVHEDCVAAVRDAAALCEELGHRVHEAAPRVDPGGLSDAFDVVWTRGIATAIDGWTRIVGRDPEPDELEPLTWSLYEVGRGRSESAYARALGDLEHVVDQVDRFHQDLDLWLTPTLAHPPPPIGWFDHTPEEPLRGYVRDGEFCPFTPLANVTGQPAMSVPLFWNDDGLPIGVQFTARVGEEGTLFRMAAQLEEARPWAHRRPPVQTAST